MQIDFMPESWIIPLILMIGFHTYAQYKCSKLNWKVGPAEFGPFFKSAFYHLYALVASLGAWLVWGLL